MVLTNFKDVECVTNDVFSEHLKLSSTVYDTQLELTPYLNREVAAQKDEKIRFLHEKVAELL
jgi:hypothetical protein